MRLIDGCRFRNQGAGFTLIEILVVVAIIALLISILLPSLRIAREQTRLTVCMANLREIGAANQMYMTESNNYFPDARGKDYESEDDDVFNGKAFYAKHLGRQFDVFVCPSDRTEEQEGKRGKCSYMVNEWTFELGQYYGYSNPLKLDRRVWRPERVVFMRDYWQLESDELGEISAENWVHFNGFYEAFLDAHNRGCNFMMMDHHVENFRKVRQYPDILASTWYDHGITMVPYFLPQKPQ